MQTYHLSVSIIINTKIKINGQKLETVTSFKYLALVITDEGSKPEIPSRIAQTTAALTRLKPVMTNITSSINTEIKVNGQELETVTSWAEL